ncbi:nucleoporin NUP42 [Bombina bombina]|uniref:nucleoporin NUP42 n=1 Tax=Bombina bombina TaxID=8345 RepID=UPI00235A4C0C|nr:nucleoporin NUP42 [Bombina bombina]
MVICSFFIQGRCRFGDKCWNEHPRDGRGSGGHHYQEPAGDRRGSSYYPPQRYVQPSSFNKSMTWTNKDTKPTFGSFSRPGDAGSKSFKSTAAESFSFSQNRFSTLSSQEQTREAQGDKDGNLISDILQDIEIWESSGQWLLSVYSLGKEKCNLSGFRDISPEELRLEYYSSKNEGNLQNYLNSIQQLVLQWKQRTLELKNLNPSTRAALINELTSAPTNNATGFGGIQQSAFGSSNFSTSGGVPSASTFSFKPEAGLAQSSSAPASSALPSFGSKPTAASFSFAASTASTVQGFGTSSFTNTAPTTTGFGGFAGSKVTPGFGAAPSTTGSASFGGLPNTTLGTSLGSVPGITAAPTFGGVSGTSATQGFGVVPTTIAGVFGGASDATVSSGFGSNRSSVADIFKPKNITSSSTSISGQPFGPSASGVPATADSSTSNALYTPRTELSAEDILQFESKKFTLGQIPLQPPPAEILIV